MLKRDFYMQDTLTVSRELLGKVLVHKTSESTISGIIVETEAYLGAEDKAAHSYNGRRTARNEVMYGPGGFSYVYFIYGMYDCFNVVTQPAGTAQAVLIRALEPLQSLEAMSVNRFSRDLTALNKKDIKNLTNGPGKLCRALNIDRSCNGLDLCGSSLYIEENAVQEDFEIVSTKRINIDYSEEAKDFPYRFYIKNNLYVSRK